MDGVKPRQLNKNLFIATATLRGTGTSGIVILEEVAFMDLKIVYDVVMPLLMLTNVVLIGISTLDDPFNFWSKMMDQKYPDGRQVFKTLRYTLVCEDCRRRGRASAQSCRHKIGDLPYWLSEEQYSKLEQIMSDQYESFLKETKGFQCAPNIRPAFDLEGVRALQDLDRIICEKDHVPHIFVAVDPSGGGHCSDYAIITAIFTGGNMTIVGADVLSFERATPQMEMLVDHIRAVRNIRGMERALAVIAVESNLANESLHHAGFLMNSGLRNYIMMAEDAPMATGTGAGFGIRTTAGTKRTMVMILNTYIQGRRLFFHEQMAVTNPRKSKDNMQAMVFRQLANYQRIVEEPKAPTFKRKEFFHGKNAGPDDLALCVQLSIFAYNNFFHNSARYGHVHKGRRS